MAKKSVKKVSFEMNAAQAQKARDFLAFALSKRTPDEYSVRKTAARKLVEQLNVALRIELGNDFSKGVRGKYTHLAEKGHSITVRGKGGKSTTTRVPPAKRSRAPRKTRKA